jgi:hypothetical protein
MDNLIDAFDALELFIRAEFLANRPYNFALESVIEQREGVQTLLFRAKLWRGMALDGDVFYALDIDPAVAVRRMLNSALMAIVGARG